MNAGTDLDLEQPFALGSNFFRTNEIWGMGRPRDLLPGLMFQRSVGIVVSEPHVGKTLMLTDLALAIATGQPWLNWSPVEPMPTLVYALDSPDWESCEQARNLMAGRGIDPRSTIPFGLAGRERTKRIFRGKLDIMDDHHLARVEETIVGMGARLVGFDSLSKLHRTDENNRIDAEALMERFDYLATKTGAHILILHHTPVAGRQGRTAYAGRGSSVIAGSCDMEWHLVKKRNGLRTMDILKGRGSDSSDHLYHVGFDRVDHPTIPRAVRLRVVTDAEMVNSKRAKPSPAQDAILAALTTPTDRNGLCAETGMSYSTISNHLRKLAEAGRIIQLERGKWALA